MEININKTYCFTGHRPDKLHGYNKLHPNNLILFGKLKYEIANLYKYHGINIFISGMALGTDLWAAEVVLELKEIIPNLKLICAIPCKNHHDTFYGEDRLLYNYILDNADYVHNVTGIKYFPRCLQIRNEWMVNNSSGQLAVWNGTKGGTLNCIEYANKVGKKNRIVINPNSFSVNIFIN